MDDILEPQELADAIESGLAQAARVDMPYVRVSLPVPFRSQYAWNTGNGEERIVHLPTDVHTQPLDYPTLQLEDGGPAAVFVLGPAVDELPTATAHQLAEDIYARAILWGQVQYGSGELGERPLPDVPFVLDDLVSRAMHGTFEHQDPG